MTRFRPCIDLHQGVVKQIVGGSLRDDGTRPVENFVSPNPPAWFAERFRDDFLTGGHVIKLGPGNDDAAREALAAWPGGLQLGGGIDATNAASWLEAGAAQVIVTSALFAADGTFLPDSLAALVSAVGAGRLVIDLSCRRTARGWTVAMNRWQTLTTLDVTPESLKWLAGHCAEFLIHAVDVEGKCEGIDEALVSFLGEHSPVPMTYAGGIRHLDDLKRIDELSHGRVDGTVGSALDLFGGSGAKYDELVAWNRREPGRN